ncbi:signal transduction histidine kinase [Nakamurella sp. UYEF19]|uniref:HAMP domain-containing sensor histidine kinase n=1 Tax=Nakamurella sp. UYEF19 TaxID=1756392 RepID=UPI003395E413
MSAQVEKTTPERPLKTVSLRRRVTVWVLLLLVLVLTVMGLVVNWLLGDALRSDLQQRLEDKAGYAAVLQEQGVTGQTLADRLAGNGVFSTFTSGRQEYIGRDNGPPAAGPGRGGGGPHPAKPVPTVTPAIVFSESDGQLIAQVALPDGQLMLSTTESDVANTLARLQQIELLAGGATVVIAGLLLVTVVRAALRPLERMSGLARRIRDGTRGRRLRPTKANTDLGRTAAAFDDMLDALETAESQARIAEDRMRQFLADASHDLRTPLAGVIAGSEQLLRTPLGRAEREERLVQVVRQARRAARLVDDLLLMTRLDTPSDVGGPSARLYQAVDPALLLEREICLLRLRRPDLDVNLSEAQPALVSLDPDQLQRALGNLLENAATVSPVGGWIRVDRSYHDGHLSIRIIDAGPGIVEADRERIFDRFVRLSTARSGAGSGLGLPISRAIVRAGGGDLRCLPWHGGACFEIVLPATHPTPDVTPDTAKLLQHL